MLNEEDVSERPPRRNGKKWTKKDGPDLWRSKQRNWGVKLRKNRLPTLGKGGGDTLSSGGGGRKGDSKRGMLKIQLRRTMRSGGGLMLR